MLLFNLYYGQFTYSFGLSLILFAIAFRLLLGNATDHLEDVVAGAEAAVKVLHEVAWADSVVAGLHAQKLVASEELLEAAEHSVNGAG